MKLREQRLIESLASEEPCLGAVFCTYNFDPAFFEEHVLRVVLKLRTDPEEQAIAFHDEARAALQATPVAVVGDARMYGSGRRLPYDLLLVRSRTFHPKLALVVYESHARILVGSCNLTRGGFEENAELAFVRDLQFDQPGDVATLRELDAFLEHSLALLQKHGTQLALVRDALRARLGSDSVTDAPRDHAVIHGFGAPIHERLFGLIPPAATITRVGVLAPFFERDDTEIGESDAMASLLTALMGTRNAKGAVLDVAASWVDSPVAADAGPVPPLGSALGALWAWRFTEASDDGQRQRLEYLMPESLGPQEFSYRDANGDRRRWSRADAEEAIEMRQFWPVRRPTLQLPEAILGHLRAHFPLELWLHPSATLDERGRVARRGLHAKLFVIATKLRGKERTYVLMGSPNASRAAMLRSVEAGGNVELAVAFAVEGAYTLRDFVPALVRITADQVQLREAEYAPLPPDPSAWILEAVHDAAASDLVVVWAAENTAPLGDWTLSYDGKELARGDGAPATPTTVRPFELRPTSADLTLKACGREVSVPIRVADLAQLPTTPGLAALGLRELLALLGRRVGSERLATVIALRGQGAVDTMLEAIFGTGFGPDDVFKAWWGIAWELEQSLSVPAFRHRLVGSTGANAVWQRLRDEVGKDLEGDEVWVYGCELVRALQGARIPEGADQTAKTTVLANVCGAIKGDLDAIRPSAEGHPWMNKVASFYAREVIRG